jgi:hypothetical protein
MSERRVADIAGLLRLLTDADVEFLVVGMSAAVLQGVPATTLDLDIVHRRTPENVARLEHVLSQLGACARNDLANRKLRPSREALLGNAHLLLQTRLGPLDVLCELGEAVGFDELVQRSELLESDGREIHVLDLPTLIEEKTRANRPKDRIALPLLLATLEERRRRGFDR